MTDLGLMHYCLGIEVWQKNGCIMLSHSKYAHEVLSRFHMQDCKPLDTPMDAHAKLTAFEESKDFDATLYRQLVGSLIYLTTTRPDISYAVGRVSQFMSQPKVEHWIAAKRILRYICGTIQLGICYALHDHISLEYFTLQGYVDSDWASDSMDRKSNTGFMFHLGSGAIS